MRRVRLTLAALALAAAGCGPPERRAGTAPPSQVRPAPRGETVPRPTDPSFYDVDPATAAAPPPDMTGRDREPGSPGRE